MSINLWEKKKKISRVILHKHINIAHTQKLFSNNNPDKKTKVGFTNQSPSGKCYRNIRMTNEKYNFQEMSFADFYRHCAAIHVMSVFQSPLTDCSQFLSRVEKPD